MTISNTTNRISYEGSGGTGPFTFSFKIFGPNPFPDLQVFKRITATGAETQLTYGTDYTVAGNN